MKLLVTGASGFIGRAICARLDDADGVEVVATVRPSSQVAPPAACVRRREIGPGAAWHDLLEPIDVVVHAALHSGGENASDAEARCINVEGTLNLARQAAASGVRRFVFLSSVKVNGEFTRPGQAFFPEDRPAPADTYGSSKQEAETGLLELAGGQEMEVTIIRPPLVYGPGVKANFLALLRWLDKGYPLPFARVRNLRSLVAIDNLVSLVEVCCVHPAAANEIFMVSDGEDVSTADLVSRLGVAMKKPVRLVAAPPKLLLTLATVAGKHDQVAKLTGNLQVDIRKTRERLGWRPAISVDQGLSSTAQWFLETRH